MSEKELADAMVGEEKYGYDLLRVGNTLTIKLIGEKDFTDVSKIQALEWLVLEEKIALREELSHAD